MLGTHIIPDGEAEDYIPPNVGAVPTDFDARTQWKGCVHAIRDQQQCGACWAFGATEAFSDRLCIASKGAVNVVLSPEDLVSCDKNNYGCDGGYLNYAWTYLTTYGAVTDECFPYTAGDGTAPKCATKCTDGSAFKKYKCKAGTTAHPTTVANIKTEIYANGPVEGGFTVYEDFFNYKSGVYSHVSGGVAGGHAIKVLGWGTEKGVDYWLCANSWGTGWGESGYFKIKQGDSGINAQMYACTPSV